jgi:hypothetical protein
MAGEIIDLPHDALVNTNIPPNTYTATTQGVAFDMSQCELLTNAIVNVGAVSVALNSTVQIQLEECSITNSTGTWTLIPGTGSLTTIATVTTTNQAPILLAGMRTQRYARLNAITVTGTTPSVAICGDIVSQQKYTNPGTGYSRSPSS